MEVITLKHVKAIVGWNEFIKYKFDEYLASFNRGQTAIFRKGKTIYIFHPLFIDEYTLSEEGITVETYYSKPDYTQKKYRFIIKPAIYSMSKFDRLHQVKLLTDEMYNKLKDNQKEQCIAYAKNCIEEYKKSIAYQEQVIKNYESNS